MRKVTLPLCLIVSHRAPCTEHHFEDHCLLILPVFVVVVVVTLILQVCGVVVAVLLILHLVLSSMRKRITRCYYSCQWCIVCENKACFMLFSLQSALQIQVQVFVTIIF